MDKQITLECRHCREVINTGITEDQYFAYTQSYKTIQEYFQNISCDIREMFISGICGKCFDKLWKEN